MLDVSISQFDSFLFWRQPIPALDLSDSPRMDEDDGNLELSEFSTFNYWKEPIARIDKLDFSLLLL
ncbi:hypothetical protein Q7C36_013996 [Tachysurus vachellii]|uniref:Protein AF1q n=1 Tax=Tachysurus vachellii TaxID=175792 RepID=A0AA88SFS6_TACVA|nr:hypothetical protein Q7C36_013996 [Tachysurus vachellii]